MAVPDNHTHLDIVVGERAPEVGPGDAAVIAELDAASAVGIDRVVQVGIDVATSRWAVGLAELDSRVLAAVALHPNDAPRQGDLEGALGEIEALVKHPRVAALGETGMDFFRTGDEGRAAQEASFRAHIGMAKAHGKALMIHDREAHEDVLRVLDEEGAPETVVMHCFSGDAEHARECARRGYYMSFAGNVTFKNAPKLREAALACPRELMLVETDAPFMTPMPFRGRWNGPYLVPVTVRFLAELVGEDLERFCTDVSANTERVYGSWSVEVS
ncbi:hydrolase, TatD family [Stackebrandtia nassauensis DSM 44728]|uniref:Hydrolase, TatD family n=1 Tax=Stackebrandtia nassauensis (strain DSM 44728 / CIP 108903 / NRRL B-16338 / NBRC 102104 / LLR-40K-21) TaxID=446470 RepID=D3QA03_STANL|nr:TatD family hydrolase [Stackebrandtia nassauensis]ADD40715.1 hydrolase, TatD family [Stackebrandtia nassauensis DSM 44728]